MNNFGYLIREGFRSVKANKQMSTASVGVLVACMLLIGGALLFSVNVNSVMGYVESMNEAKVWVLEGESDNAISVLGEELAAMDNIESVTYVSKEAALELEKERIGEDFSAILEGFEDDIPYPASFTITVKDLSRLSETVTEIKTLAAVDDVTASTELAKNLTTVRNAVNTAGLVVVAILAMVSIIIIGNTIKVTVYNRSREISIMKYVGATDAFIRVPFLIEGVFIGLLSALLAFGMLWGGYSLLMDKIMTTDSSWLAMTLKYLVDFSDVAPALLIGFVGAGTLFGLLGTLFFVGKYLKA